MESAIKCRTEDGWQSSRNSVPSEPGGSAGAAGMERRPRGPPCPEISDPSLRLLHESIVVLKEFLLLAAKTFLGF